MHELGVVFYIIDECEKVAIENNAKHINSVTLDLGEVSAVIPEYLIDCWKWAVERKEITKGCTLKINTIKGITFCENCKEKYDTIKHGKTCPNCGSTNTYLIHGKEVNIKEIEVI